MKFTPREIIALCVLLPASFCGLAAAEESLASTPPASIPDCQTKLDTFLIINETGESGESGVASKPRAAGVQAVIDACKAGESARALEAAKKLIAATPDRADLADLLVEAGGMLGTAKQFDPAAGFYRLLIDHYPQSKHLEHAHAEFAACYYQSGKLKEAHQQVKENLKLYPKSKWVEYWEFLHAQISFRLHDFANAETGYDAFLAKYPNSKYATYARADLGRIASQSEIDRRGIVPYSGAFEMDIRFQAALAATPKHIEDGYGILERRLGIDLRNYANVPIFFKNSGFKPTSGVKAHTRIVVGGGKQNTTMEFFTEYVVNDPEVFRKTVVHEMKHAGFAEMMGGQPYGSLPGWIKEGLANRLWLGRALIDAGRHDDGRAVLQLIIDEDVERCTLLDDAQFFIGYSYNLQHDAKSLEAFGVLLRDFPYSVHAK